MANKERGEVVVTLDKERTMKFTLNSLVYAEEHGVDMQNLGKGSIKIKDMRTILYAALMHEDKDLTPEAVGELIDLDNLPAITEALTAAFGSVGK